MISVKLPYVSKIRSLMLKKIIKQIHALPCTFNFLKDIPVWTQVNLRLLKVSTGMESIYVEYRCPAPCYI